MSDVTATLRVESPDLPLTETVAHDDTAAIQPISGAGTTTLGAYLFTVRSNDFERFETGLERDHTVAAYDRVVELGDEAVYRVEYSSDATVLSGAIVNVNGISLEWRNDGTAWNVRVWLPDREALSTLWEWASDHDIGFSLERVSDHVTRGTAGSELTEQQHDALRLALERGYFEEPRHVSLSELAAELGISQPAAGGLLRRGLKRLVMSRVAADIDEADPGR